MNAPLGVDTHGMVLTPKGEIVFNYEDCGTVKLDQCGRVMWTLPRNTHHSIIASEAGGYWLLDREKNKATEQPERAAAFPYATLPEDMLVDEVLRIDEDGKVLDEFSIPAMMIDNGLEALLTAGAGNFSKTGKHSWNEIMHVNKVAELTSDIVGAFPMFKAGDLLISDRARHLLMVVDPRTRKVKWHQIGPWLSQHDPEFRPDGKISVFNNSGYYFFNYDNDNHIKLSTPHTTSIIAIDPATREPEVLFGARSGEEMLSVIRGQHELLPDGGMLIAEFDAGRVLEVNADREIVWEYVNAYDKDYVGEITNAQLIAPGYLQTEWRQCTTR